MSAPCRPEDTAESTKREPRVEPGGRSQTAAVVWHPAIVGMLARWLIEDRQKEVERGQLR